MIFSLYGVSHVEIAKTYLYFEEFQYGKETVQTTNQ
jgi:hypothetical protein